MGAIANYINNRKRDPFPLPISPSDFHISKKPKFSSSSSSPSSSSSMHQNLNNNNNDNKKQFIGYANSTIARISRYPETTSRFRREVHAPCRNYKFGQSKPRNYDFTTQFEKNPSQDHMGNFLNKRLDSAKKSAIGTFRYLVSEKNEVIDVDKDAVSEDSSVEEVGNEVKVVEERSVVSSDDGGNNLGLGLESNGKLLDSLALNREEELVDVSSVEAYKKLLESVERRDGKLRTLGFQIELNERRWDLLKSLRPVKKSDDRPVQEIPHEPFIPLTEEEQDEVNRAFSASNRRKVLVSHKNSSIDITGQILQCLGPTAWLNDEVINLYLDLLKEREKRDPTKFLRCHFFSTFFYKRLTSGGSYYDYKAVRRWTTERKLGYFLIDCDKIFVPVHREIHWCLAIINKKDQKFQYLDSLKGRDSRVLEYLARYYVDEVKDKSKKDIDVSTWEREFLEDLPEQENGYDCGVFMIKYADFYSRGLGLCFSQEHMPYFRLRTAKEILRLRAD